MGFVQSDFAYVYEISENLEDYDNPKQKSEKENFSQNHLPIDEELLE